MSVSYKSNKGIRLTYLSNILSPPLAKKWGDTVHPLSKPWRRPCSLRQSFQPNCKKNHNLGFVLNSTILHPFVFHGNSCAEGDSLLEALRSIARSAPNCSSCLFIDHWQSRWHSNADTRHWYSSSVRLSVCHVQVCPIASKWLNMLTYFFQRMVASLRNSDGITRWIQVGHPTFCDFLSNRPCISAAAATTGVTKLSPPR